RYAEPPFRVERPHIPVVEASIAEAGSGCDDEQSEPDTAPVHQAALAVGDHVSVPQVARAERLQRRVLIANLGVEPGKFETAPGILGVRALQLAFDLLFARLFVGWRRR